MSATRSFINLVLIAVLLIGAASVWAAHGPRASAIIGAALYDPLGLDVPVQIEALLILSRTLAAVDTAQSHAYKHGIDNAEAIRKCINNGGLQANIQEPDFGYWIQLCEYEPGRVGMRVLMRKPDASWKEITAYPLRGIHTVKDVVLDMLDAGSELGFNLLGF